MQYREKEGSAGTQIDAHMKVNTFSLYPVSPCHLRMGDLLNEC